MNCKPGDLARITGLPYALSEANDHFVQLSGEPPIFANGRVSSDWCWKFCEPIEFKALASVTFPSGTRIDAGDRVIAEGMPDKFLRPIRGTSTDESVESALELEAV